LDFLKGVWGTCVNLSDKEPKKSIATFAFKDEAMKKLSKLADGSTLGEKIPHRRDNPFQNKEKLTPYTALQ